VLSTENFENESALIWTQYEADFKALNEMSADRCSTNRIPIFPMNSGDISWRRKAVNGMSELRSGQHIEMFDNSCPGIEKKINLYYLTFS
jgi:hypothetical protein